MPTIVNVQEAKARLSELLKRAQSGEVILLARAGTPVARLQPLEERRRDFSEPLRPGFADFDDSALFEPMTEDELAAWEGTHPNDPLAVWR